MSAPPVVNRHIIEASLPEWLPAAEHGHRLVLAYGRFDDPETVFATAGDSSRRVHVADEHSVLGIITAWQDFRAAHGDDDDVLVVTTSVAEEQLGWEILGYAAGRRTRGVDKARIVAQRFGAADVDPRIGDEQWLIEALLDAEPPGGWPRNGAVLTRDTAVRALIAARLGSAALVDGSPDTGALLEWSSRPAGPARFAELADDERGGLRDWLAAAVGPVAPLLLQLAEDGRAADAMPLGVVGAAVVGPEASQNAALALGGLLGGVQQDTLRKLTEAVAGTLERWILEAASAGGEAAQQRVFTVVRRADELAAGVQLTSTLASNRFLPSSFDSRLRELATALDAVKAAAKLEHAEQALAAVRNHALSALYPQRIAVAEMAVRLQRWLTTPRSGVASVAAGVSGQLREWAWVDRAFDTVWAGDAGADPTVGQAYRELCEAVRERREELDEAFARRLTEWVPHASATESGGCLLIEQVQQQLAVPLARKRAPLIIVADGMSGLVATELGEQLARAGWTEVSPREERAAAVAVLPSVTTASRASLLTGEVRSGQQGTEKEGFAAFWRKQRRDAVLFHKAELAGQAGHYLAESLVNALSGDGVVGVVLNTVDDALDHGREGDRTAWRLGDITYLPELLDAARGYGRPVLLVSDHGHVLDRGQAKAPTTALGASARWRTGTAEPGEVALSGPRVVYGDGSLVVPWREDIHYTARKYGYHGGASLAEMTVPVLALLPAADSLPPGWQPLSQEAVTPDWWRPGAETPAASAVPPETGKTAAPRRHAEPEDIEGLFPVAAATGDTSEQQASLGQRVVATELYTAQRGFIPRAPENDSVAVVIDALAGNDGVLSLTAVAAQAGKAGRRPEFFAATLQRLLNVDGYPVLSLMDGDRRLSLNREMLRTQFGVQ